MRAKLGRRCARSTMQGLPHTLTMYVERQFLIKRFSAKAIATGTFVAFALDLLTGIVSLMIFSGDALQAGATQDEIRAASELVQQNDAYLFAALVLGTLTTVVGGYVTARLARQLPLLNACAMGVLGVGLGILLSSQSESPLWLDIFGTLVTLPAAIAGGYWGRLARSGGV